MNLTTDQKVSGLNPDGVTLKIKQFGSSGCIDLGQNARDFFEQLESSGSNNIRLRVSFKSSNIPL